MASDSKLPTQWLRCCGLLFVLVITSTEEVVEMYSQLLGICALRDQCSVIITKRFKVNFILNVSVWSVCKWTRYFIYDLQMSEVCVGPRFCPLSLEFFCTCLFKWDGFVLNHFCMLWWHLRRIEWLLCFRAIYFDILWYRESIVSIYYSHYFSLSAMVQMYLNATVGSVRDYLRFHIWHCRMIWIH